jgi:LL-diaminopimelate aminotransferase
LKNEAGFIEEMLALYGKRRELVLNTLKKIGIDFNPPRGTFYLWAPVPKGMTSLEFTNRLFDKTAVVVAAGTAYGQYGEGFVRISLTVPDERLKEAMIRIEKEFK